VSVKRRPIDLDAEAFRQVAEPHADPVARIRSHVSPLPLAPAVHSGRVRRPHGQASRVGKVQISVWVTELQRRELKVMAVRNETTIERLLSDAIDALIA
jgi:hypothetical protein